MTTWKIVAFNGTAKEYSCSIEKAISRFCRENNLQRLDIFTVIQVHREVQK